MLTHSYQRKFGAKIGSKIAFQENISFVCILLELCKSFRFFSFWIQLNWTMTKSTYRILYCGFLVFLFPFIMRTFCEPARKGLLSFDFSAASRMSWLDFASESEILLLACFWGLSRACRCVSVSLSVVTSTVRLLLCKRIMAVIWRGRLLLR